MADDGLREFYIKAGKLLPTMNTWRHSLLSWQGNDVQQNQEAFCELMKSWAIEFAAAKRYSEEEKSWRISYGVWNHSGRNGDAPIEPSWPLEIPDVFEAMLIVRQIMGIYEDTSGYGVFEADQVANPLENIIFYLDHLKRLLETHDDQSDGLIDRNQLAKLLGIQPKTLKNRADELSEPIARNAKQVPIYRYSEVRPKLLKMYPEKECFLVDWSALILAD